MKLPRIWLIGGLASLVLAGSLRADVVEFRDKGRKLTVEGNILDKDDAGTILFEGRDSQHYVIPRGDQLRVEKSKSKLALYTKDELRKELQKEFGSGFRIHQTKQYLVCYNCSTDYAKQSGRLLERVMTLFVSYFNKKGGFELEKPKQPLVAVIFESFDDYAKVVGKYVPADMLRNVPGIYIPRANRMFTYNAFGGQMEANLRVLSTQSPGAAEQASTHLIEQNVSTLVHEAIHHVAYNSGLHNRSVQQQPTWLVEGMAMYFETPDLDAKGGWRGVTLNKSRLSDYKRFSQKDALIPLQTLICDDSLFRTSKTALAAYADAWAFNYYLAKFKGKEYMSFLRKVKDRKALGGYEKEDRIKDLEAALGYDIERIEADYRKHLQKLNPRK